MPSGWNMKVYLKIRFKPSLKQNNRAWSVVHLESSQSGSGSSRTTPGQPRLQSEEFQARLYYAGGPAAIPQQGEEMKEQTAVTFLYWDKPPTATTLAPSWKGWGPWGRRWAVTLHQQEAGPGAQVSHPPPRDRPLPKGFTTF